MRHLRLVPPPPPPPPPPPETPYLRTSLDTLNDQIRANRKLFGLP